LQPFPDRRIYSERDGHKRKGFMEDRKAPNDAVFILLGAVPALIAVGKTYGCIRKPRTQEA
jgi:hypothetical protein